MQNYKEVDVFRCLRNDKQLIFSKDIKIEEIEDNGTIIQNEMFDFFEHGELKTLVGHQKYLTGK